MSDVVAVTKHRRKFTKRGKGKPFTQKDRKMIKAVAAKVARPVEKKMFIRNITSTVIDNNPAFYFCLTQIAQGLLDTDRIGDQVYIKNAYLRLQTAVDPDTTSINANVSMRMIMFQAHEVVDTTGAVGPALNTIYNWNRVLLDGPSGFPDIWSQYNHDRRELYTILYDKTWHQVGSGGAGLALNDSIIENFVLTIPLGRAKKKIQYVGGGTNNASNHIFLLIIGPNNTVDDPFGLGSWKLEYTDS